ncbi:MAG TPA: SanA protein [Cytophagales bacterium]|nr:SanA protein [Cytophagales bacterium]HAA17257.1 SanA protein [Cytophagales bacterium]HAP60498.1 SanA protein [Cytophagales bacterium]
MKLKRLIRGIYALFSLVLVSTILANAWVINSTREQVYHAVEELPKTDVVLVLGTSKRTVKGDTNPFFENRMAAAITLFEKGKVNRFVVSGHNPSRYYNEPRDMREVLVEAGVPEETIFQDTSGSRTYESMLNLSENYPGQSVTIITQEFHGYRALFLADHLGVEAVAYAANNTTVSRSFDILVREYFARIKAVAEVVLGPETVAIAQ